MRAKFDPRKMNWWADQIKIPNVAPDEFECIVCNHIRPPDEFQCYDPMVCIDCDMIDMALKFKGHL